MTMDFREIPVSLCLPSPTARPVDAIKVVALARSIAQVGLRQPINVRPLGDVFEMRGGGHRHAAFVSLGLETIPAFVREDDDLRAELAEIDENLVRNELSAVQRDLAITRRKAIYEALHPETVHGATGRGRSKDRVANDGDSNSELPAQRFSKATSDDIGLAERTIQRSVSRVEEIGTEQLARLDGTSLDRGDELDALAKLPADHRERLIAHAEAGEDVSAKAGHFAIPGGARTIMGSRVEPPDSADYFPTPPWATRALVEHVLPYLRIHRIGRAWEPAAGEGHIAEVLREYTNDVIATDLHDYGYEGSEADNDFLTGFADRAPPADWIITNPPFGDKTEQFVVNALRLASVGVAMFVRLQWLETISRYEAIFRDTPPTTIAFFCERVNLCKGRWEPEGSTATAYIWLVWLKNERPRAPFWIPPKRRTELEREGDRVTFTSSPVLYRDIEAQVSRETRPAVHRAVETVVSPDEDLDIPSFLRRPQPERVG